MPQPSDLNFEVVGLNDFLRALRSVDKAFSKELRVAAKAVAAKVADRAQQSARSHGAQAALGAASIRAASDRIPTIAYGGSKRVPTSRGKRVPAGAVLFGADFGSQQSVRTRQFPSAVAGGRILWPTIRQSRQDIMGEYNDAVTRIARAAGFTG